MPDALFSVLRAYLAAAALLGAGWVICSALIGHERGARRFGARTALRLAQTIYLAALTLPWLGLFLPRDRLLLRPTAQVFSDLPETWRAPLAVLDKVQVAAGVWVPGGQGNTAFRLLAFSGVWLVAGTSVWYLARAATLAFKLRRLPLIRAVGGVKLLAGEGSTVPYAAWLPGITAVVLPLHLFRDVDDLRIVASHELQHHRQGDTRWVHLTAIARAAFFWNPAAHAWCRIFDRLQEYACDEGLLKRHPRLSAADYGRCLLRVAETTSWPRFAPAGTAGMATGSSGRFLRRRIEMMLIKPETSGYRTASAVALGTMACLLLASVALASRSLAQDRRLAAADVEPLAAQVSREGGIPLSVNDLVIGRLNGFLGTPEKRQKLHDELMAMGPYQKMIEGKLAAAGMPASLLAVPLFESGFKSDVISSHHAAGIWQFVPTTARKYGLKVSGPDHPVSDSGAIPMTFDERLDAAKETDAAIRYLKDLHLIFEDWRLALKAYNEGESHVIDLIRLRQSRDPWELERAASSESYLPGAEAMMIILRNPKLLD